MKLKKHTTWLSLAAVWAAGFGCGASADEEGAAMGESGSRSPQAPPSSGGDSDEGVPAADAGSSLPPEQEVESFYESPIATERFVWVANPMSGRVAYVDGVTLEVRIAEAGNAPTYLAAVSDPQDDVAIVINKASRDGTILRAKANGELRTARLQIGQQANTWAVSKSGRWAIAWTDARYLTNPSAAEGCQEVAVVSTTQGAEQSTRLSVGYRPVKVAFSDDDTHAFAVTQDGISVIALDSAGGASASGWVPLSDDPLEDPGTHDVEVTPDGSIALIRRDGSSQVEAVRLTDGARQLVELWSAVTDLDMAPDGERAVAVMRDTGEVAILHVAELLEDPLAFDLTRVSDVVVGSVAMASGAPVAVLYSNASDQQGMVRLEYELAPARKTTVRLHAPVLALFVSADGAGAVVVHNPLAVPEQGSGYQGAFSVANMAPPLPAKIVGTLAPPTAVAIDPSGDYAVVAERSDPGTVYGAYLVRMRSQQVDRYPLASPPHSVGSLPSAGRVYVAQQHPEGRLTFIDTDTGQARTLTGFELAAHVVE